MTITKEQVDAWDGEVNAAYQSGFTAGAEAKLQSLLADVEMPGPDTHCFDTDTNSDVWSYSKEAVAAAVATKDAEIAALTAERDDQAAKVKVLREALQAIVTSLVDQDDEGMIEHAQQMIDARAALEAKA